MNGGGAPALVDAVPVALFEADPDMVIGAANARMAEMLGLPMEEIVGRSFRSFLTRSSQFVYALKAEPSLVTRRATEETFLELDHRDGRPRAVLLTVRPDADRQERLYGALFAAPERRAYELELIAARRLAVENLEALERAQGALQDANAELARLVDERTAALAQRDLLLREVYHRVKNNLQVVDGLLMMHARKIRDPAGTAAFDDVRKRVFALGLVHHQLMGSADLKTFDIGAFLSELTMHLQAGAPDNVTLKIDCSPLKVDLDFAVPLGLLITELVTNAMKHAFPSGGGEIAVALEGPVEGEMALRVSDTGVGLPAAAEDAKPSLGLAIVKGLVRQLGGRIETGEGDGVRWEARLPAPSVA
ncbi:sensor histidine kinase [uncultured Caulobacter sp.]|uniref:sensor histidine kinase n=1 Tax=uncultured Caulobacter sp. TaxID=158749 RepID=UPI002623A6C7|nr:PAS domain-containing sensor histidine kinase [uncultured Caulobacter sp.]